MQPLEAAVCKRHCGQGARCHLLPGAARDEGLVLRGTRGSTNEKTKRRSSESTWALGNPIMNGQDGEAATRVLAGRSEPGKESRS